jgi:4-hydroxybenzoate polyprenyltransferase
MKRLLPYAQLVRLPNTFTAMADIFLGAIATGLIFQRWYVFVCLLLSSTMLYWSGMIWNDYFDIVQDRRERPSRPLACGIISMSSAWWLATGLMCGGVLFAFLAGFRTEAGEWHLRFRPLVIAGLLVVSILLYDGVLKATVAGPVMMGLCRFLNILLGLSIFGPALLPFWGWLMALVIGLYVAGITWFARTEAQASSQPMLIGAAVVMLVSLILALTVPALVSETVTTSRVAALFPYLLAAFGFYLGIAVIAAIRRPDPGRVQPVIKRAILGLVVLDALLASAFVGVFGLLLAILLVPGIILGRWLYST